MSPFLPRSVRVFALILSCVAAVPAVEGQGARRTTSETTVRDSDGDHVKERNEWFMRGRLVAGKPSAELRRRAYAAKLQLRAQHAAMSQARPDGKPPAPTGSWVSLGPVPLASDATGNGTQDYHQVAGRATAHSSH